MHVNIIAPTVKASIVKYKIALMGNLMCLRRVLASVAINVAAANVKGAITKGFPSINIKTDFILIMPISLLS